MTPCARPGTRDQPAVGELARQPRQVRRRILGIGAARQQQHRHARRPQRVRAAPAGRGTAAQACRKSCARATAAATGSSRGSRAPWRRLRSAPSARRKIVQNIARRERASSSRPTCAANARASGAASPAAAWWTSSGHAHGILGRAQQHRDRRRQAVGAPGCRASTSSSSARCRETPAGRPSGAGSGRSARAARARRCGPRARTRARSGASAVERQRAHRPRIAAHESCASVAP